MQAGYWIAGGSIDHLNTRTVSKKRLVMVPSKACILRFNSYNWDIRGNRQCMGSLIRSNNICVRQWRDRLSQKKPTKVALVKEGGLIKMWRFRKTLEDAGAAVATAAA